MELLELYNNPSGEEDLIRLQKLLVDLGSYVQEPTISITLHVELLPDAKPFKFKVITGPSFVFLKNNSFLYDNLGLDTPLVLLL